MKWTMKKVQSCLDFVASIFEKIIEWWVILRIIVVAALILYITVTNILYHVNKFCERQHYEKMDVTVWTICYYVQCRGTCEP